MGARGTVRKRGRRPAHYHSSWGEVVNGLSRRATDGRWRIIATGRTFTEPDERRAVERFRELTRPGPTLQQRRAMFGGWSPSHPDDMDLFGPGGILAAPTLEFDATAIMARLWAYVARQIRERPRWVAEKTGDERLGYLPELKPPKPLPTFGEIERVWREHFKRSTEQKRKVLAAWADFKRTTGARSLQDITPELAISYRDDVHARAVSGKSQANLFTRIRRLFTFARSREIAPDALAKVIDALKRLVPSGSAVSLDPKPVETDEWQRLLAVTEGDDRAMVLLMPNGGYYVAEVIRLRWDDVKAGAIVTHRAKEGKCVRACVLWPETVEALDNVRRRGEFIFYSYAGSPLGVKGAEKRFRVLRERADLKVTSSQLRDGAATAMAEANVTEKLCAILLGHRSGISDHYVKRNAKMVASACEAIYRKYFGG